MACNGEDVLSSLCSSPDSSPTRLVVSSSNVFRDIDLRLAILDGMRTPLPSSQEAVRCTREILRHARSNRLNRREETFFLTGTGPPTWHQLAACHELERKDVDVLLKVFPTNADVDEILKCLDFIFWHEDSHYVDSLQLAPPVNMFKDLGLLKQMATPTAAANEAFARFWRRLSSSLVTQKCLVRRIGLADVRASTLQAILDEPGVVLNSYYVTEDNISPDNAALSLAIEEGLSPRVHGDPLILVTDDDVKELAPNLRHTWTARMVVRCVKDDMQVLDKRWIMCLDKI